MEAGLSAIRGVRQFPLTGANHLQASSYTAKKVSSITLRFINIRRVLQAFEGWTLVVTAQGQTLNKPRSRWLYSPMFGATRAKSLSLTPIHRANVAAS